MVTRLVFYPLLIVIILMQGNIFRYDTDPRPKNPEIEQIRHLLSKLTYGKLGKGDVRFAMKKEIEVTEDARVAGQCWINLYGMQKEVDIDRVSWNRASLANKVLLVAHEEIHCACGFFFHKEGLDKFDCPLDIMGPYMPSKACANRNWNKYLQQMRLGCDGYGLF